MDDASVIPRQKKRDQSAEEMSRQIRRLIAPLQSRGFYGKVPMELDLQDGIVTIVTSTGPREVAKIRLPAAAA